MILQKLDIYLKNYLEFFFEKEKMHILKRLIQIGNRSMSM